MWTLHGAGRKVNASLSLVQASDQPSGLQRAAFELQLVAQTLLPMINAAIIHAVRI